MYEPRIRKISITERLYQHLKEMGEPFGMDMHEVICASNQGLNQFSSVKPEPKPKYIKTGRPMGRKPDLKVLDLSVGEKIQYKYPPEEEYPNDPKGNRYCRKVQNAYKWHERHYWTDGREHKIVTGFNGVEIERTK